MRAFVEARVKPYYLHHLDLAPGTSHFRTSIAEGQALMRALRGRLSGIAQPTYVLDIPGGHGKVPIGPGYLAEDGTIADPAGRSTTTRSGGDVCQLFRLRLHRFEGYFEFVAVERANRSSVRVDGFMKPLSSRETTLRVVFIRSATCSCVSPARARAPMSCEASRNPSSRSAYALA